MLRILIILLLIAFLCQTSMGRRYIHLVWQKIDTFTKKLLDVDHNPKPATVRATYKYPPPSTSASTENNSGYQSNLSPTNYNNAFSINYKGANQNISGNQNNFSPSSDLNRSFSTNYKGSTVQNMGSTN